MLEGVTYQQETLPLLDVNPFDRWHFPAVNRYGFRATDKSIYDRTEEHFLGAVWCRQMIEAGLAIRPIAVCKSDLVPLDIYRGKLRPYFRLDGFKRWLGHKLAGKTEIECYVLDDYVLGPQKHQSMTLGTPMGEVRQVLAADKYDAQAWPYQGRLAIEDCKNETVHVHLGHIRLEFYPDQFLRVADRFTEAAQKMRARGPVAAALPKK